MRVYGNLVVLTLALFAASEAIAVAGHQPYVAAFRQQHSRRLRRHTNRTNQSRSRRFRNKQRGRSAQPVHRRGCRLRRHCYHPARREHDERPHMVKLGPSRAEHETGGEAISAETIRGPPRHPITQAASTGDDKCARLLRSAGMSVSVPAQPNQPRSNTQYNAGANWNDKDRHHASLSCDRREHNRSLSHRRLGSEPQPVMAHTTPRGTVS